jgi:hypothetical protein
VSDDYAPKTPPGSDDLHSIAVDIHSIAQEIKTLAAEIKSIAQSQQKIAVCLCKIVLNIPARGFVVSQVSSGEPKETSHTGETT